MPTSLMTVTERTYSKVDLGVGRTSHSGLSPPTAQPPSITFYSLPRVRRHVSNRSLTAGHFYTAILRVL